MTSTEPRPAGKRRCAFLTMESLEGFVSDDELLLEPLARRGWAVEMVPWRRPDVQWSSFDAVLVRTTWDYWRDPEAFLRTLEEVERSPAVLFNPLELIRWNLEKTYLRDLSHRGVTIVPTRWGTNLGKEDLARLGRDLDTEDLVLKPVVGANASRLVRVGPGAAKDAEERALRALGDRAYLAQPFVPSVVDEGEYSLFYFGGRASHAVLKRPASTDFRVQEEHGGRILPVSPVSELEEAGRRALAVVSPAPLYARVDLVRIGASDFAVMELELVEPALYFRMDPGAPGRFARHFDRWMEEALP